MSESRQIETPITSANDYLDRIGKIVPPEITGAYLAIQPLFIDAGDLTKNFNLLLGFSLFLTVLVPTYLWKFRGVSNKIQLAFSALSFPIWAGAISAEQLVIRSDGIISNIIVTLVMVAWSLLIPIFVPAQQEGG